MTRTGLDKQLFALRSPPPQRLALPGRGEYRLKRVFKHDFFAATCLYQAVGEADVRQIVVKYTRTQPFCGLPMEWLARWMRRHEADIYRSLEGLEGIPRHLGEVGRDGYAIEYVDAAPLDHLQTPPRGFFDRLLELMRRIHSRGVAYTDANKRSNILVRPDGSPVLVDYQISIRRRDNWPWPLRTISRWTFAYIAERDIYHVLKHKRRMAPDELTDEEEVLSRSRGGLHRLHRKLSKGWRHLRRGFLRKRHRRGWLRSPTAEMEDHHQPEKSTWRNGEGPAD
ncbi:MAG: hypothetical protein ACP5HU_10530 [Phycisphaerae bacterium]